MAEDRVAVRRRRRWIIVSAGVLALILAMAWLFYPVARPPYAPALPAASVQPPVVPTIVPGIKARPLADQQKVAFRSVYGKNGPVTRDVDGSPGVTTPAKLLWIGDIAALITSTEIADACHACVGSLGIHYLRPTATGFDVIQSWPEEIVGQGFGSPPSEWSVSDKFGVWPVVYSAGGFTGQGYSCTSFELTELTPDGPRKVASVPIEYDDSGAAVDRPATTIKGKITDIVPGKSFAVRYTGAGTFTDSYIRSGAAYRLSGKSKMQTC